MLSGRRERHLLEVSTFRPMDPSLPPPETVPFVSYAQHGEDVLLWRALQGIQAGFYIDVGAYHPVADSVTQAFYERGWSGINIEPVPACAANFPPARPRDINLAVAVSDQCGSRVIYEAPGTGLSTFDLPGLEQHRARGLPVLEYPVPTLTLASICRKYVRGEVHFLKIDAENSEEAVLRGADLQTSRPWIILIESTLPNSSETTHPGWEHFLLGADYEFLFFDGINRYYSSAEKAGVMRPHFDRPANPVDGYRSFREIELDQQCRRATAQAAAAAASVNKLKARGAALARDHASALARVKALEHRIRYHTANPWRALKLWLYRHRS